MRKRDAKGRFIQADDDDVHDVEDTSMMSAQELRKLRRKRVR